MADEIFENDIYTSDEDGKENDFELIGSVEVDGNIYYALIPIQRTIQRLTSISYQGEKDENGRSTRLH